MNEMTEQQATAENSAQQTEKQDEEMTSREGRHYAVSCHRGKAKGKIRYIEGNTPKQGCRFL